MPDLAFLRHTILKAQQVDEGGQMKMDEFPTGGQSSGLLRTVLRRDAYGRPVETEPFARRRQAQEGTARSPSLTPKPDAPHPSREIDRERREDDE
jgi:hypothetical protein